MKKMKKKKMAFGEYSLSGVTVGLALLACCRSAQSKFGTGLTKYSQFSFGKGLKAKTSFFFPVDLIH